MSVDSFDITGRRLLSPAWAPAEASREQHEIEVSRLYEELRESLYRYVFLLTLDPDDSSEITQEAFLRLYECLLGHQGVRHHRAWLFRVAHNLAMDRGRRIRPESSLSDERVSRSVEESVTQTSPSPEQALLEKERRGAFLKAMQNLPTKQRQCLFLRREGLRYKEIADILAIRESTVVDHIRRGIERLAEEVRGA